MNRRKFVQRAGAAAVGAWVAGAEARGQAPFMAPGTGDAAALKRAAQKGGRVLGMYTVAHELLFEPAAAAIIAQSFEMIADGNDLKFSNRLRPTPTTFDFSYGDASVKWAEQHQLLFRGHCLVWWNGLPDWFKTYVTPANAKQVLTNHVSTVVKHYAGRVYSWDVVNEVIYHDNRPDGLRQKPWLDLIGPNFIDLAFHTAAEADPKARRVINECYIEHGTPAEVTRRGQLLALVTRLKQSGVPVTDVGLQSHLRGATPIDGAGMRTFCKQVQDLGLELMVTELDVDSVDVPANQIDQVTASKYAEYLDVVGPYVKSITFEQLRDDPTLPKRADGITVRPNLFDQSFQEKPAFASTLKALSRMPAVAKRQPVS